MNKLITKDNIKIENMIYEIRGKQVMLDSDLAKLYQCKNGTKDINKAVKRNIERFPNDFYFQLLTKEYDNLKFQYGTSSYQAVKNNIKKFPEAYYFKLSKNEYQSNRSKILTSSNSIKYSSTLPYVFTEKGIFMLATILKSEISIEMSMKIINAFVAMRHFINENKEVLTSIVNVRNDIDNINNKLIEHDNKFNEIFDKLNKKEINKEYIFFKGQIYDSYSKIIDILNTSKESITIIDSYADKVLLDIISKINKKVILITKNNSLLSKIDIDKYKEQYNNLSIKYNNNFHDRYIILDNKEIYHIGTSINHIGCKTFSINKLEDEVVISLLLDKIKNNNI